MKFYIGIADLVANALIEVLRRSNRRALYFEEIEKYGANVIEFLNGTGSRAILILSREDTNSLLNDYSDLFEEFSKEGKNGISLRH